MTHYRITFDNIFQTIFIKKLEYTQTHLFPDFRNLKKYPKQSSFSIF